MSGIVVYGEAVKPLTRKRIFQLKLRGAPLCFMYTDMIANYDLLLETEIYTQVRENNIVGPEIVVNWPVYVVYDNGTHDGRQDHSVINLQIGNKFLREGG